MAAAPASPTGGPPPGLAAARQRLEELFEHWLGLEETEAKISEWVRKAERGELPAPPAPSLADLTNDRRVGTPPTSPHSPDKGGAPSPPPHFSPGSSPTSSRFSSRASSPASTPRGSPLKRRVAAPPPPSPPRAPRIPPLLSRRRRGADAAAERAVADLWRRRCAGDAMAAPDFAAYAAECCELPSTIGAVLAGRLARRDGDERAVVRLGDWLGHWRDVLGREDDARLRLFAALSGERDAIMLKPAAFSPLLDALLARHPGLAFLSDHAEFQDKYAATVVARIFYRLDSARTGAISRRGFLHGGPCLLEALFRLDADADVNREPAYFSYEHFYVIYCR